MRACLKVNFLLCKAYIILNSVINTFKQQPHKMVKHTQTIRRQFADELFECV